MDFFRGANQPYFTPSLSTTNPNQFDLPFILDKFLVDTRNQKPIPAYFDKLAMFCLDPTQKTSERELVPKAEGTTTRSKIGTWTPAHHTLFLKYRHEPLAKQMYQAFRYSEGIAAEFHNADFTGKEQLYLNNDESLSYDQTTPLSHTLTNAYDAATSPNYIMNPVSARGLSLTEAKKKYQQDIVGPKLRLLFREMGYTMKNLPAIASNTQIIEYKEIKCLTDDQTKGIDTI
jgi:hypothetical protein